MTDKGKSFSDESARRIARAVRRVEGDAGLPKTTAPQVSRRNRPPLLVEFDEPLLPGSTAEATPLALRGEDDEPSTDPVTVRSLNATSNTVFYTGDRSVVIWVHGRGYVPAAEVFVRQPGSAKPVCNEEFFERSIPGNLSKGCTQLCGGLNSYFFQVGNRSTCCGDLELEPQFSDVFTFVTLCWTADCQWQSKTYNCDDNPYGQEVRFYMRVDATFVRVFLADANDPDAVLMEWRKPTWAFNPFGFNKLQFNVCHDCDVVWVWNGAGHAVAEFFISSQLCLSPFPYALLECDSGGQAVRVFEMPLAGLTGEGGVACGCAAANGMHTLLFQNDCCPLAVWEGSLAAADDCQVGDVLYRPRAKIVHGVDPTAKSTLYLWPGIKSGGLSFCAEVPEAWGARYEASGTAFRPASGGTFQFLDSRLLDGPPPCSGFPASITVTPKMSEQFDVCP